MPRILLGFLHAFAVSVALSAMSAAQDAGDVRTTVHELIDGTVRGATYQAALDEQQAKIQATWKRVFLGKVPVPVETPRLFLVGTVPSKSLKDIGATLEKQYALAAKALGMEHATPWPGKMSIFFLNERNQFASFLRVVEQRRPEEGEAGTFHLDGEWPYIVASGPLAKSDPPVDGQAGEQLAAALMRKKGGARVPSWFLAAFGRATVTRGGTTAQQSVEHRRAYQFLAKNKRTLKDVSSGNMGDEEATILRANFVEYLAYSGRIGKFIPIVEGFRPREGVPEPTLESAIQAANVTFAQIDGTWQKWVKTLK